MLGVFSIILDQLKTEPGKICIDNWVFKLHYRVTVIIFLISTILVTLTEYFGDRIKCISDSHFSHVIETYCFFTSTFTLVSLITVIIIKIIFGDFVERRF